MLSIAASQADAKAKLHVKKYCCPYTPRTPVTRIASGSLTRRAYHIAVIPVDQDDPSSGIRQQIPPMQRTLSASSFEHHLSRPAAPLQKVGMEPMEVDSPKAAMNNGPLILERTLSASSFNSQVVFPPQPAALKAEKTLEALTTPPRVQSSMPIPARNMLKRRNAASIITTHPISPSPISPVKTVADFATVKAAPSARRAIPARNMLPGRVEVPVILTKLFHACTAQSKLLQAQPPTLGVPSTAAPRRGLQRQGAIVLPVFQEARPAPLTRARARQLLPAAPIAPSTLQRQGTLTATIQPRPAPFQTLQRNEAQLISAAVPAIGPHPLKRTIAQVDPETRHNLNIVRSDEPAAKRLKHNPLESPTVTPAPKWPASGAEPPIVRVSKAVQNTWHFKAILNKHRRDLKTRLVNVYMEASVDRDVDVDMFID